MVRIAYSYTRLVLLENAFNTNTRLRYIILLIIICIFDCIQIHSVIARNRIVTFIKLSVIYYNCTSCSRYVEITIRCYYITIYR